MEQRTDEWFDARLGKVTASALHKVLAMTKTGPGAERGNYITQLVLEIIKGQKEDSFSNAAMEWGVTQEPFAKAAYEALRDVLVEDVGFVSHPTIEAAGASPDGLVGDDGMIEIKCPDSKTAMEVWLTEKVDSKYFEQMQWQMRCADRAWCDYVVFDPRLPKKIQLFVKRIHRDDAWIESAEAEVIKFLAEVDAKVAALKKLIGE